jgi:acyl-homoserine-lactone acylase
VQDLDMKKLVLAALLFVAADLPAQSRAEIRRWERQAQAVTITRDTWGVPHVKGKTDADAVFGVIYAQAEDDFNRVETNYLTALGRMAEAEGEGELWRDLRMRMFVDTTELKAHYAASPEWLKRLMNAWADGLNYFLYANRQVKPKVLTRFEPWMALSFTEGSIGGDISSIPVRGIEQFYGARSGQAPSPDADAAYEAEALEARLAVPTGSNGVAIAPANTKNGRALLLINPHTSHYFREEAQMTSDEGLNAYGAITWGQFFIYQGFNATAGWMHTSSNADVVDEYAESVTTAGGGLVYAYGGGTRPVTSKHVTLRYKTAEGMKARDFTLYFTHHGPVVREVSGKWIAVRLMNEPVKALTQSYTRTKARNYREFRATMALHTNSSNNTIYADAEGNIAYLHANFVPRRDPKLDWSRPVDGSNPATEWGALHDVEESPLVLNPPNGWLYNTNNWPYTAAGEHSPRKSDFPTYMNPGGENPRGVHAIAVLSGKKDFTLESLHAAAYDSWMPAFTTLIPRLVAAWDHLAYSEPLKAKLAEPIALLRGWDHRWGAASVPTSLAIFYGEELWRLPREGAGADAYEFINTRPPEQQLQAFARACDRLMSDFGSWKTPWGEINRFQRLVPDIAPRFDDSAPSVPVGFASARWGSLASYDARAARTTKKLYGTYGNSFVAVVEFGERVRARAVMAGGLNANPSSKHFADQAKTYADGQLRDVYFYPEQLQGHTERTYRPGAKQD